MKRKLAFTSAVMAADIQREVPDAVLHLDYEGTETFASLKTAGDTFGYGSTYTVISQHFHNERAMFYASLLFKEVSAYDAADTDSRGWRFRNRVREWVARTKAVLTVAFRLLG